MKSEINIDFMLKKRYDKYSCVRKGRKVYAEQFLSKRNDF